MKVGLRLVRVRGSAAVSGGFRGCFRGLPGWVPAGGFRGGCLGHPGGSVPVSMEFRAVSNFPCALRGIHRGMPAGSVVRLRSVVRLGGPPHARSS